MDDLNLQNYRRLIEALGERGYRFYKFQEMAHHSEAGATVLLRHDVDFSVSGALQVAEVEAECRVVSTFFFHLRSPLYNILSDHSVQILQRIDSYGHDVALHFDIGLYGDSYHKGLIQELDLFSRYYPFGNTGIVSLHRPGRFTTNLQGITLPNRIRHTYEAQYFSDIRYFSDSRGNWQEQPLSSSAFNDKTSMQILTHPMWWTQDGNTHLDKMDNYLRAKKSETISFLEETAVSFSLSSIR